KAGASPESRAAASEEARREQEALGGAAVGAKTIFTGFGIGLLYKTAYAAFRTWKDTPEKIFGAPFTGASVAVEISPELLGVGYDIAARVAAAILFFVFGFLFVTVSSRLTGEIGSSSNPISGMTVATLLLTCLVFLMLGWTGSNYFVTALSIGAIVCIASSNGGTTSQDLKTGYLVGATPSKQQISILIGALASALVLGPILLGLNNAYSVYVPVGRAPAGVQAGAAKTTDVVPSSEFHGRDHVRGIIYTGEKDAKQYNVWFREGAEGANAEKYLVDDAGHPVYYVDPGINGA